MLKLLLLLFSIFFIYFNFKSSTKGFILGYIILLALPIGSTNKIMDYLDVISISGNGINLIHIIIFVLFFSAFYKLITERIYNYKMFRIIIFIFIPILIGIIIGIINNQSIIPDGQKYIMFLMWIFSCTIFAYNKINFDDFMNYTNIALIINFLCMIFMNIFRDNFLFLQIEDIALVSQEQKFVSYAANISIVTILYCVYIIAYRKFDKRKHIITLLGGIIALIYNLFFASNRTIVLVSIVAIILLIIFSKFWNGLTSKQLLYLFIFCSIGGILILYLSYNNSEVFSRLLSTDFTSLDPNLVTRIKTFVYYMKLILMNILGYGFGRTLPLINQFGRFHGNSNFTDNSFINVGMKTGWLGLILLIGIIIFILFRLIMHYRRHHENMNILLFISYGCFIFLSGFMTGQIMNNYPITFFFGIFTMIIYYETLDKCSKIISNNRIGIMISDLDGIGGAATVVKNLSLGLKNDGYDIYFIGSRNNSMEDQGYKIIEYDITNSHNIFSFVMRPISIMVRGINKYTGLLDNVFGTTLLYDAILPFYKRNELKKIIKDYNINIIIGAAGYYSMLLGSISNSTSCFTIGWQLNSYKAYFETKRKYLWHQKLLFENTIKSLDKYVVLNEVDQKELLDNMNINSTVIYNPKTYYSKKKSLLTNNKFIAAGHLWQGKGFDLLLESFSIFCKTNDSWILDIYGVGPEEKKLRELSKMLNIDTRVNFKGNSKDLFNKILDSSCFVLSSRWEGMPMVILDALEAGVPIIAYDISAMKPLISTNIEGFIIPKYDTKKFSEAMLEIANNINLRYELGKNACKKAELFDLKNITSKWIELWTGEKNVKAETNIISSK